MSSLSLSAKIGLIALSFFAGYSFCKYVDRDERYSVLRKDSSPYLYDNITAKMLRIHEQEFQVGSLEYRLEGVLRNRNLPVMLETLSGGEPR